MPEYNINKKTNQEFSNYKNVKKKLNFNKKYYVYALNYSKETKYACTESR